MARWSVLRATQQPRAASEMVSLAIGGPTGAGGARTPDRAPRLYSTGTSWAASSGARARARRAYWLAGAAPGPAGVAPGHPWHRWRACGHQHTRRSGGPAPGAEDWGYPGARGQWPAVVPQWC